MGDVDFRCANCGRSYTNARAHQTVTGRLLCERCDAELWGLASGRVIDDPERGSTIAPSFFRRRRRTRE
jgi:DNA-directed RNA polymerase subunit RPC12/RpoP